MNILVTGGLGFIGLHLSKKLESLGHKVSIFDKSKGRNVLNIKQVDRAVKKADIVYHLAALTSVQDSLKQPQQYGMVNMVGTANVLYSCLTHEKKLIYTSTAAIYDKNSSFYAKTKYLAELLIRQYIDINPLVVLRLFNVYGQGMNKETMIARFIHENPITIYGDGRQTRDFIHIDDVTDIMADVMHVSWNGFIGDVGTGKSYTVNDVVKMFDKPIEYKKMRKEVKNSKANIKKLRRLYQQPFTPLEVGVAKLLEV